MHYLALLSLLAVSASAVAIERSDPIVDPIPIYVTLPGWHACPNQCVVAVLDETLSAGQEPVCFDEPAHDSPCSYYYCCGKPVTCGFYKEVCVPGTFDTSIWVPSPTSVPRPVPETDD